MHQELAYVNMKLAFAIMLDVTCPMQLQSLVVAYVDCD
jgi:hypothetical protein